MGLYEIGRFRTEGWASSVELQEYKMAKRTLLKGQDRHELFDIPTDEDSLIRHYSLSPADRLEIELRRRSHNQLGFAVQLCLMRYPGRTLMPSETLPSAMLNYIATQINADARLFGLYARREETRRDHIAHLLRYLEMRSPTGRTAVPRCWQALRQPPQQIRVP